MQSEKIEKLELSGYVCVKDGDVFLEVDKKEDEYYYPRVDSIGQLVATYFTALAQPFDVNYSDWRRGDLWHYKDVFVQYFVSDRQLTWRNLEERQLRKLAGDMTLQECRDGYSEVTITDSWTEIFVGGHDLRKELRTHEGRFVSVRINYKVPTK